MIAGGGDPLPAWAADYIGIPFLQDGRDRQGCDCWGLARMALQDHWGYSLPSNEGLCVDVQEAREAAAALTGDLSSWAKVAATDVAPGDVVMLRIKGAPAHVGLMVTGGQMLHVIRGIDACIESISSQIWRRRVYGFYRWAGA